MGAREGQRKILKGHKKKDKWRDRTQNKNIFILNTTVLLRIHCLVA